MRRFTLYTARSGVSIRYLRAALPTTIWPFSSSATTDGTRFSPSSPGMTTGRSPSMYATSELVVPRSIPTMRSLLLIRCSLIRSSLLRQTSANQHHCRPLRDIWHPGSAIRLPHAADDFGEERKPNTELSLQLSNTSSMSRSRLRR